MALERTLSIIKPDATRRNLTGKVNARLEEAGLRIVAQKRLWLTRKQAEQFYAVHKERPFFNSLCEFMTSGPVVPQAGGRKRCHKNREVMGATFHQRRARHHPQGLRGIDRRPLHGSVPLITRIEIAY
jgi:nucleoside-diphosphate kinase